ncbi:MAG TPA: TRAP transporter small permease [Xanthobacteraceae bacterium]|nr:TRAP transporter small permease [Xanthobacteraceae bacterium]
MSATPADRSLKTTAKRALRLWDSTEQVLAGVLGLVGLGFGLWQVLGRYLFPREAISYAEEVIVYLIIWAVMLISSDLVGRDGHVRSDLVLRLIPRPALRWIEVLNCIVALVFCGGLVWYGWQIVDTALLLDERSSTDLQFPKWIYYLSLPVGSALMLVRYLFRLARYTMFYEPGTTDVGFAAHQVSVEIGAGGRAAQASD